jgi:PhnB protein
MPEPVDLESALRALPSEPFRARLRADLERITMTTNTTTAPSSGSAYEPVGMRAVRPYLIVASGSAAIDFYRNAFEAEELERHTGPDQRVAHAKVRIGETILELGEHPDAAERQPQPLPAVGLRLYVPDVDETYARAIAAGAPGGDPPSDRPYGARAATVYDPFGLTWWLATPTA